MSDHHHSSDAVQIDDPEAGSTWFVSIAGTIIFLALVYAICVLYFHTAEIKTAEVVVNVPSAEFEQGRLAQRAKLAQTGPWVEKVPGEKKGEIKEITHLAIPIEDAMKLVGAELSGSAGGAKR